MDFKQLYATLMLNRNTDLERVFMNITKDNNSGISNAARDLYYACLDKVIASAITSGRKEDMFVELVADESQYLKITKKDVMDRWMNEQFSDTYLKDRSPSATYIKALKTLFDTKLFATLTRNAIAVMYPMPDDSVCPLVEAFDVAENPCVSPKSYVEILKAPVKETPAPEPEVASEPPVEVNNVLSDEMDEIFGSGDKVEASEPALNEPETMDDFFGSEATREMSPATQKLLDEEVARGKAAAEKKLAAKEARAAEKAAKKKLEDAKKAEEERKSKIADKKAKASVKTEENKTEPVQQHTQENIKNRLNKHIMSAYSTLKEDVVLGEILVEFEDFVQAINVERKELFPSTDTTLVASNEFLAWAKSKWKVVDAFIKKIEDFKEASKTDDFFDFGSDDVIDLPVSKPEPELTRPASINVDDPNSDEFWGS